VPAAGRTVPGQLVRDAQVARLAGAERLTAREQVRLQIQSRTGPPHGLAVKRRLEIEPGPGRRQLDGQGAGQQPAEPVVGLVALVSVLAYRYPDQRAIDDD